MRATSAGSRGLLSPSSSSTRQQRSLGGQQRVCASRSRASSWTQQSSIKRMRRQSAGVRTSRTCFRHAGCRASAIQAESTEVTDLDELCGIELPAFESGTEAKPFDLLVVGCGPAGLAVAEKAGSRGLSVGIIDPAPLKAWPNNYGVWVDEFDQLGLTDCIDRTWSKAKVRTKPSNGLLRCCF